MVRENHREGQKSSAIARSEGYSNNVTINTSLARGILVGIRKKERKKERE